MTVTNAGNASASVSASASGDFSASGCGTLAAGASCTITVTFTPTASGARSGTLSISSDPSGGSPSVPLSGTGVVLAPAVSLSPSSLSFAARELGTTSPAQAVTLANTGNGPLSISGITAAGDFAVSSGCGSSVPAGASCSLSVTFTPTAVGARSGSVSVASNASGSPHGVSLSGSGLALTSGVNLSPLSLTFDTVVVGQASAAKTVTLANTGNGPLAISGISVSGEFAQSHGCGSSLAAGGSCTISVTFKPTAVGTRTGTLSVASSASGSPHSVTLSGTGIILAPSVQLSPSTLTFAVRELGSTSPSQAITLANVGNSPLGISSIAASGDFARTHDCGSTVAAGSSCTIQVTFTPTAVGTRSGAITISDNAAGSPRSVSLIGSGSAAGPVVSMSMSPGAVMQDKPAALTVGLGNANALPMSLGSVAIGLGGLVVATPANASISAPCSGSLSAAPGAGSIGASGLTLPTTGGCSLSVDVTSGVIGEYAVTVAAGTITGQVGGGQVSNSTSASASLKVTSSKVPVASVSPASLSFGKQRVGSTSAAQQVTVTNTGQADLVFETPAVSVSGDFAAALACPDKLAPGVSCSISVTFMPTAGGDRSGQLAIASNADPSPAVVSLGGIGESVPAPNVSLSPSSLSFPAQALGTTSAPRSVTMANTGNADLAISQIVAAAGDFSSSTTCGSTLAAGASCAFTVTFSPLVVGTRTGSIQVTDSAVGSPRTIALSGTGSDPPRPNVSVDPASIAFGAQMVGNPTAGRTVTIRNSGGQQLELRAIELVGAGFAMANQCGATLAPGATCTVVVSFVPQAVQSYAANVRILSNAAGFVTVVGLSGQGTAAPVARLEATPASIAFNDQTVGTTSAPQTLTLTNGGNAPVTISRMSVTGDFALEGTCIELRPGESCVMRVTFAPSRAGQASGQLVVESNAAEPAFAVGLSGNGTPVPAPKVALSATALTFANTLIGGGTTQAVMVTNTGAATLAFGAVEAGGEFRAANGCMAPLAPGQSCRIDVEFAPRVPGDRTGTLHIVTNAEGSPHAVGLSGVGCRFALRGRSFSLVCAP